MEKLLKIQKELKAPKNQYNSFGGYKFRSCEDILESVKPILDGAILTVSDELVNIGNRYYVKATATFIDGDFKISTTALAREPETKKGFDESQLTGMASSYARKYALNGLFLIDDTKDADTNEYKEITSKAETKPAKKEYKDLRTVEEFKQAIDDATSTNQLGALYHCWSELFKDKTDEFKVIQKYSQGRRIELENPGLHRNPPADIDQI